MANTLTNGRVAQGSEQEGLAGGPIFAMGDVTPVDLSVKNLFFALLTSSNNHFTPAASQPANYTAPLDSTVQTRDISTCERYAKVTAIETIGDWTTNAVEDFFSSSYCIPALPDKEITYVRSELGEIGLLKPPAPGVGGILLYLAAVSGAINILTPGWTILKNEVHSGFTVLVAIKNATDDENDTILLDSLVASNNSNYRIQNAVWNAVSPPGPQYGFGNQLLWNTPVVCPNLKVYAIPTNAVTIYGTGTIETSDDNSIWGADTLPVTVTTEKFIRASVGEATLHTSKFLLDRVTEVPIA